MQRIAWLALAGLVAGCRGGEQPATPITSKIVLRYHPPAGTAHHYLMNQTSSFGSDSGSDTMGVNTLRMAFTQTVGTAEADGVPVTYSFDSTTVESPGLNPAAVSQVVDRLKDSHLTTIYDDHLRPVRDAGPLTGLPPLVRDQLQAALQVAAPALPDQPVGAGDRWTTAIALPLSGIGTPITVHTTMTVREISVSRGDTTVRLGVETALPAEPMQFAFGGQQFTVALKGAITGEQTLSLTRGAVVSAALGGTMHVGVSGGFFGAPGMKVRVQQQGTLKLVS